MNELTKQDKRLPGETMEVVSAVVQEMMTPIMEGIGRMLKQNAEAMEQIAATQKMTSERIASLERQVRLQKPLSKAQEKCVNDAIRARARELLDRKGYAWDRRAVTKLGGAIRRSVLARYGVGSLREAPAYDYEIALKQVGMWNDLLTLRDVTEEARARAELERAMAAAERQAGADGAAAETAVADPAGELDVPALRKEAGA